MFNNITLDECLNKILALYPDQNDRAIKILAYIFSWVKENVDTEKSWDNPIFCRTLIARVNEILLHLDPESPMYVGNLLDQIEKEQCKHDYFDWKPDLWNAYKEREILKEKSKIKFVGNCTERCSKCKKNNTYVTLVQTRSADEPATQRFRCLHCDHRWRKS